MCLMISYYGCGKKEVVNIYESEEYKALTKAKKFNDAIQRELDVISKRVKEVSKKDNIVPADYPEPYKAQWEETHSLKKKPDINGGQAIWSIACFRCHMYGTNGATLLQEKEYWDAAASKGIDELFESVWEGKQGEDGVMPAKGFCNLCSEDEIRKSVFYIFHLAKKVQVAEENKSNS